MNLLWIHDSLYLPYLFMVGHQEDEQEDELGDELGGYVQALIQFASHLMFSISMTVES